TQVDLFLDQLIDAPLKDERALMEFPFFSLQKRPRLEPFVYDDGNVKIEISPGAKGMATIWDKDLLIYIASLLNDKIERGGEASRTIRFPAHDFLQVTGRGSGKRAYELFLDALFRLRTTNIATTIQAGDQKERRGFGWIESWRVVERTNSKGEKVMAGVEVTLNDWMFRSIVQDRRVLTINRKYFALKKGLERRLYEMARKHVGRQNEWLIRLPKLAEKCGTTQKVRQFKADLKKIMEADSIPDYRAELIKDPTGVRAKGLKEDGYPVNWRAEKTLVRFSPK
uniref:replication initiator protein A n=1 Tax=Sneathiella aquimaris TaxID=2599305 RepID=UPI00146CA5C3